MRYPTSNAYVPAIILNISNNKREKARNATLIIQMNGPTTEITDPAAPNEPPRKFTFDYSYWSHDGFEKNDEGYLKPTVPHYADQVKYTFVWSSGLLETVAWAIHRSTFPLSLFKRSMRDGC